jgi:hypothetical protein
MVCTVLTAASLAFRVQVFACNLNRPGILGVADYRNNVIWLDQKFLPVLKSGVPGVSKREAEGIYVLAHELGHLRSNSSSEKVANNWARENFCFVVKKLNGANCYRLWFLLPQSWKKLGVPDLTP